MKRFLSILALFFCVSALFATVDAPKFRLTYSVFFPATHVHTKLAQEWAQEIFKRTDGAVKIDVYAGCVLSGANENYECVIKGVSHLGMSCFSYSRGMFPMLEGLDLPLGYRDGKQATRIANAYLRKFQPKELSEVQVMYLHAHGPGVLATTKSVTAASDLKGLSVRGTGISAMIIRAFGGNAIGMGQPDTYEALRKGVVDATLCPIETLKGWRQGEVINSVVRIPSVGYTTGMFVVMNRKIWLSLPLEYRKIITEINEEWIPKHGEKWDEADAAGVEFLNSLNKPITTIAPEENAKIAQSILPVLKNWAQSLEQRGLPGNAALEFLQNSINTTGEIPLPPQELVPESAPKSPSPYHPWILTALLVAVAFAGVITMQGGRLQEKLWGIYRAIVAWLCHCLAMISGLALLAIIILTIADIIGRHMGTPIPGAIDLIQLLACLSTAAAIPYVTAVKGHIAVEFFFQRLTPQRRIFWDTLNRLTIIIFFMYLAIKSFQHGSRLLEKNAVALSLGIPIFWILWVMGVSFCLVILVVIYNLTHPGREMIRP